MPTQSRADRANDIAKVCSALADLARARRLRKLANGLHEASLIAREISGSIDPARMKRMREKP